MENVLVISDTHEPFGHKDAVDFCREVKSRFKCTKVVHIGDEVDQCALSNFDSDPDGMSAGEELTLAKKALQKWYKAFPVVDLVESNHGLRPFKKAFRAGIPKAYIKTYKEFLDAPVGWNWQPRLFIDDVLYFHGEPFAGERGHINAATKTRMSTVIGHLHCNAGVSYLQSRKDRIFALNVGCLIDDKTYPFKYAENHATRPTLGCGVILGGKEAFFLPMK